MSMLVRELLYADSGKSLLRVIEDTVGKHHDLRMLYNPNNKLRYGVEQPYGYTNFTQELQKHGMDVTSIVPNVNWFMSVPVLDLPQQHSRQFRKTSGRVQCSRISRVRRCIIPAMAISLRQLKLGRLTTTNNNRGS